MKQTFRKLRIKVTQIIGCIIAIAILLSTSAWDNANPFVGSILFLIGVILLAIASFGRLWCSLYIGGFKTNSLITTGPYSLCRNPLYFFSFLGAIGIGLATETIFYTIIIVILFALYYPLVIKAEEAALESRHGEKFHKYLSTTPSFFPKFSIFNEPDAYTVNPKIFRKDLFQTIWFVWAIGLLEIIEELHALGVIPRIFNLY